MPHSDMLLWGIHRFSPHLIMLLISLLQTYLHP